VVLIHHVALTVNLNFRVIAQRFLRQWFFGTFFVKSRGNW
jgi:hypothetical protein